MKLVLAYISPEHFERVRNALVEHHIHGLTVMEARGFGQEHDHAHPEHREFMGLEMTRKLRLEIACHDAEVQTVVQTLYESAHTGRRGDGKILVLPIEDALRIKTGERGDAALGPGPG